MEVDLQLLLRALLKKCWVVALAAIMGACAALVGTFYLMQPQYESSVILYVDNNVYAEELEESFSVIVKMRETLLELIRQTDSHRSHVDLRERITVRELEGTDFFEITVSCPDPYEAERLANGIGAVLPGRITEIMEEFNTKVVDEAVIAAGPSSPSYPSNAFLGGATGILLSVGAIVLGELFGKRKAEAWQ